MDISLFNQAISEFSFYYQSVFTDLHGVVNDDDKKHIEKHILELKNKLNKICKFYRKPKEKKIVEEINPDELEEGKKRIVKEIKEDYNNFHINTMSEANYNIICNDIEQIKRDFNELKKILKKSRTIKKKRK